jgi:hypothetical protein
VRHSLHRKSAFDSWLIDPRKVLLFQVKSTFHSNGDAGLIPDESPRLDPARLLPPLPSLTVTDLEDAIRAAAVLSAGRCAGLCPDSDASSVAFQHQSDWRRVSRHVGRVLSIDFP